MVDELLKAFEPFQGKENFAEFVTTYIKTKEQALTLREEVLSKMEVEPLYSLEYCVLWSIRECLAQILMD
ncbi:hypothetical protein NCTGTJJY_CDS0291 [Serratia phage 92A1]|nr:hypothetical protein NCTGTJJY_CDS0291 [Serratia phage 92A1]